MEHLLEYGSEAEEKERDEHEPIQAPTDAQDSSNTSALQADEWPAHVYVHVQMPGPEVLKALQQSINDTLTSLPHQVARCCSVRCLHDGAVLHVSLSKGFAVRHKQRFALLHCLRRMVCNAALPAGAFAQPVTFSTRLMQHHRIIG